MQRRLFMQASASLALAGVGTCLLAAPTAQSRLLLVFLRGGCDAASVLVPVSSSFYYEARPNISIGKPSSQIGSAVAVDADWALHPALRDSIGPLLAARQACFVPFCGIDDLSRSHFETQDSIELGQPIGARRDYRSGFLNRLVSVLNGPLPISFTDQLPIVFQGTVQVPNIALRAVSNPGIDARQGTIISSMYQGTNLAESISEGVELRKDVMRGVAAEMEAASRGAVNAKGFELEARRIARQMREHYEIGFVDVGGWDTHVNQGAANGYLAGRLEELGRGLAAFASEMGNAWQDTTVVVLSEFGRTFRENGNRGTDHGHGGVMWILGGATKPRAVVGDQIALGPEGLFQNRDWPVLNDSRAVLGGLFARQFGLNERDLQSVFPSVRARDLLLA